MYTVLVGWGRGREGGGREGWGREGGGRDIQCSGGT